MLSAPFADLANVSRGGEVVRNVSCAHCASCAASAPWQDPPILLRQLMVAVHARRSQGIRRLVNEEAAAGRVLGPLLHWRIEDCEPYELAHFGACAFGVFSGNCFIDAHMIRHGVALEGRATDLELGQRLDGSRDTVCERNDE